jgi:hypothetical protein
VFKDVFSRTWLSPATAITFAAVAATGILMLVEVESAPIKGIHQWIGLAFAIAGLFHLILNWRAFIRYFRSWTAVASLVAGVALCVALGLTSTGEEHHGRGHGGPPAQHVEEAED